VKEYQEKDKIGSKPNKNRKRGEAGKSQKQLQSIKEEKLKKTQKEGPEMHTPSKYFKKVSSTRAKSAISLKFNERGDSELIPPAIIKKKSRIQGL
nr:hypothetical protein [Tanacetum cinerariifolium]